MMTLDWLEISFDFFLFQGSSLQKKKGWGGVKGKILAGLIKISLIDPSEDSVRDSFPTVRPPSPIDSVVFYRRIFQGFFKDSFQDYLGII